MPEAASCECASPLVRMRDVVHSYPDGRRLSLAIDVDLRAGDCLSLTGPTGSGKTSLLHTLAGLLPGRTVGLDVEAIAGRIGIAFQNPVTQLFFSSVEEEVAFAPRNRGCSADEVVRRVCECLAAVGLQGWQQRNVDGLSMGEKHRVVIAATLSTGCELLLLDEPFAQLDAPGAAHLRELLQGHLAQGGMAIVSEHHPEHLEGVTTLERHLPGIGARIGQARVPVPECTDRAVPATPLVDIRGLNLMAGDNGTCLLERCDWEVAPGERVHIQGANGCGKSSLLRALLGLEAADCSRRVVAGHANPGPAALAGAVGFLHQDPDAQLFAASVDDEIRFARDRLVARTGQPDRYTDALQTALGLDPLRERSPLTLSHGEKHLLALAALLACRPQLVLLDEPFVGLDIGTISQLLAILRAYVLARHAALIMVSHDPMPDSDWASRRLVMAAGALREIV